MFQQWSADLNWRTTQYFCQEKKKKARISATLEFLGLLRGNFVNGAVGSTSPFLGISKPPLQRKAFYSLPRRFLQVLEKIPQQAFLNHKFAGLQFSGSRWRATFKYVILYFSPYGSVQNTAIGPCGEEQG